MKTTHFMQTWINKFFYLAVLIIFSTLTGCGGGGGDANNNTTGSTNATVLLKTIAITPDNPSLASGVAIQLSAMGTYSDGTTKDISSLVTWSSSSSGVSVSNLGKATGIAVGISTVSASLDGLTGKANISVTAATLQSVSIIPDFSMNKGQTRTLTATGVFSDGTSQDISNVVTWVSLTPAVATINTSSLLTALSTGTTIVNATLNGISGSTHVSVGSATLQSISIAPINPNLAKGLTQTLVATGTYSDGTSEPLTTGIIWSSDKATVATVTSAGLVSAVNAGAANISAKVGNLSANTALTVSAATLQSISITPTSPGVIKGLTQTLVATGTYSDGTSQAITTGITWFSDNTTIATVTNAGLVSAVNAGAANISAKVGSVSGSTALTVNAPTLQSIGITPINPTLAKGLTQNLVATGTYSDGKSQPITTGITWSSDNTTIATVTSAGLVTAVNAGTANITAKVGSLSANTTLTVSAAILQSISITTPGTASNAINLAQGLGLSLAAKGTYSDGSVQSIYNGPNLTWSSDNTTNVTITSYGYVTAVNYNGDANISATVGNISGSIQVSTAPPILMNIRITPVINTLAVGLKQQFKAMGDYSNGGSRDLTGSNLEVGPAKWYTSDSKVATPSILGLVTAVSKGRATISASVNNITGSLQFGVVDGPLESIWIAPTEYSLIQGQTTNFMAKGTFSSPLGSYSKIITSEVIWSSSDSSVAVVTPTGILRTSYNVGTTTISATFGNFSVSTTVTVTAK